MKYTENYSLRKPEPTDYVNIADLNYNADVIDDLLKTHNHSNGNGGQIDHGSLSNLDQDTHLQYLTEDRHDTTTRHTPGTVVPVVTSIGDPGSDSNIPSEKAVRSAITSITSVTDHGALIGLDDDDHTQYLNTTRHDTSTRHTPGTVVPVVTSVGSPGSNSNIPSEAAVRSAVDVHKYRNLQVHLDGGTSEIPTGWRGSIVVPIKCTITGWYLLADDSGSLDMTVTKTTYSNYPTGSSILTPSLSSAQKGSASDLSISCSKDDILTVTVDSCSSIKFCELVLVTVVS